MFSPVFMAIGIALLIAGVLLGPRLLYSYSTDDGGGHLQSVILLAMFLGIGFQIMLIAFVADLLGTNRKLLEGV